MRFSDVAANENRDWIEVRFSNLQSRRIFGDREVEVSVYSIKMNEEGEEERGGLERVPGVQSVAIDETVADRYRVDCQPRADSRQAIFELAVERGWVLLELAETKASLEEIFVRLTTHEDKRDSEGSSEPASRVAEAVEEPPEAEEMDA